MSGPSFLRNAGDLEVVAGWYLPTFIDGARVVYYNGKRAWTSPENFEWMKTASPADLGAMRVVRFSDDAPSWIPTKPILGDFRYKA